MDHVGSWVGPTTDHALLRMRLASPRLYDIDAGALLHGLR